MAANGAVQSLSNSFGIGPMGHNDDHTLDKTNGPFYRRRFPLLPARLRGNGGRYGDSDDRSRFVTPLRGFLAAGALALAACAPAVAAESTFDAPAAQRTAK